MSNIWKNLLKELAVWLSSMSSVADGITRLTQINLQMFLKVNCIFGGVLNSVVVFALPLK